MIWDEVPLSRQHDRTTFDCGDSELNIYLQLLDAPLSLLLPLAVAADALNRGAGP